MDKKTYMILLVGVIFVVLLSNNNTLEGLTCNELQAQVSDEIKGIKEKMHDKNLTLYDLNNIDVETTSLIKNNKEVKASQLQLENFFIFPGFQGKTS